jgi:predicted secreted hydrolase
MMIEVEQQNAPQRRRDADKSALAVLRVFASLRRILFFIVVFCALIAKPGIAAEPVFKQATEPREWSFPRDHGRHDGFKIEWWYFTGNLRDSSGHRFGYQLTFFRSAFRPEHAERSSPWGMTDLYFAHAAITDIDGKTFVFKDRLQRARVGLAYASDQAMDVQLLDWSAKFDARRMTLRAGDRDLAIDLVCTDGRGPILQGPGGVNAKGREPGQASYYYSMTRLKTAGALSVGGKVYQVEGTSWMDHEFSSNALGKDQVGWDWMGLQLDDGTDLMVYRLRTSSGATDYLSGTRITADGQPHYLSDKELSLEGSDVWRSPSSGGAYPQRWTIHCAGLPPLVVRSELPGQELITSDSTEVSYFEGAAEVLDEQSRRVGEGYLEMTGYSKSINGSR